jgi:hypothetical protein
VWGVRAPGAGVGAGRGGGPRTACPGTSDPYTKMMPSALCFIAGQQFSYDWPPLTSHSSTGTPPRSSSRMRQPTVGSGGWAGIAPSEMPARKEARADFPAFEGPTRRTFMADQST